MGCGGVGGLGRAVTASFFKPVRSKGRRGEEVRGRRRRRRVPRLSPNRSDPESISMLFTRELRTRRTIARSRLEQATGGGQASRNCAGRRSRRTSLIRPQSVPRGRRPVEWPRRRVNSAPRSAIWSRLFLASAWFRLPPPRPTAVNRPPQSLRPSATPHATGRGAAAVRLPILTFLGVSSKGFSSEAPLYSARAESAAVLFRSYILRHPRFRENSRGIESGRLNYAINCAYANGRAVFLPTPPESQ
jgi:hypothetical protein